MHHFRKTKQTYVKFNKGDKKRSVCTFCDEVSGSRVVAGNETMFILPNRVSYDMFEGQGVIDHLLIIPKRHVETINDFENKEKIDQMTLIGEYEAMGYNVYARGVGAINRSVKHQHTHLIKMNDKKAKAILFTHKPYLLLRF